MLLSQTFHFFTCKNSFRLQNTLGFYYYESTLGQIKQASRHYAVI